MKKIVLALLLSTSVYSASSQNFGMSEDFELPKGLSVGQKAPEFAGTDQNGNNIELIEILKKGPVVLIFYRGYWCGYCNKQLDEYQQSLTKLTDKGASIIAISPESNEGAGKIIQKNEITFSVLSDSDYSIMDQYDVRFLVTEKYNKKIKTFKGIGIDENNQDEKPYLPVPAVYIIDSDRTIKKVWFDSDYRKRPSVEDIASSL